jgi:hypothetical protein
MENCPPKQHIGLFKDGLCNYFDIAANYTAELLLPVRLEVFTSVTMKNGVFSDVTPCGSCKNRHFGRT